MGLEKDKVPGAIRWVCVCVHFLCATPLFEWVEKEAKKTKNMFGQPLLAHARMLHMKLTELIPICWVFVVSWLQ